MVISAIDGMAGVGKTTLAVHAAHRLADRFGDGQLFIDLHGYTQGYRPRTADQALEAFLRAMSVPPREIPRDTEERAALFRERLARDLAVRGPAGERDAALDRLLGYYQHTALRADARIARYAQPGPAGPAPRHAPALPDPDTARAWLRVEQANLSACLRYAVDGGLDARIVALSAGLGNLFAHRRTLDDSRGRASRRGHRGAAPR